MSYWYRASDFLLPRARHTPNNAMARWHTRRGTKRRPTAQQWRASATSARDGARSHAAQVGPAGRFGNKLGFQFGPCMHRIVLYTLVLASFTFKAYMQRAGSALI